MFLFSPIEQFNFVSLCSLSSNYVSFLILNIFIILFFLFFILKNYNVNTFYISNSFYLISFDFNNILNILNKKELKFIPSSLQYILEIFILNFFSFFKNMLLLKNIYIFLNIILVSILFILNSNLLGLIPFTYTITAQIIITLNLSLLLFISFNFMGIQKYKFDFIQIIIPSGLSLALNFLLIPIELISYIFRPISLAIRLFANIMAGHTLLKVICSFIYRFFNMEFTLILSIIPFFILVVLYGLELFVALIQAYVFFILVCIFLKDIINIVH
jgi:F-type H+-transporting ATPase subunit a